MFRIFLSLSFLFAFGISFAITGYVQKQMNVEHHAPHVPLKEVSPCVD